MKYICLVEIEEKAESRFNGEAFLTIESFKRYVEDTFYVESNMSEDDLTFFNVGLERNKNNSVIIIDLADYKFTIYKGYRLE